MRISRPNKRRSKKKISEKQKATDRIDLGQITSTSNQRYAQVLNFDELKRILLQNVSKTATKTYATFTKEKIQQYLQSPHANLDNIRDVSMFLWRYSMPYRKIIEYYSSMPYFAYDVVYKSDLSKNGSELQSGKFLKEYQTVLQRLENMHFADEDPTVIATALRDGAYFGFCYDDESSFFTMTLDPKYCRVSSYDGCYNFSFDATYFDQGNNSYFIDSTNNPDGIWDQVFIDGYNEYKSKGRDFRWFEIPPERGKCIIAGDDPVTPLPYFVSCFVDLLDLLDYQELIRSKTELENYVLLISKIPLHSNSDQVNDFSVDLDLVQATQSMIDDAVPSLVGTAFTPCELDVIRFDNKNQVEDTNIYGQALSNFMSNVGMSEMIGNSNKGGSVGLAASIKTDELVALKFLTHLERWVQHYLRLNISENFIFTFHKVTQFSKDQYHDQLAKMATLGVPVKMAYATSLGYSPLEILNRGFFEQALHLDEVWIPLQTSYTQTDAGRPSVDDGDLSDEGADSRDAGKNEGTKAKKKIS